MSKRKPMDTAEVSVENSDSDILRTEVLSLRSEVRALRRSRARLRRALNYLEYGDWRGNDSYDLVAGKALRADTAALRKDRR